MKSVPPPPSHDWQIGVKLWIDRAGKAILGKGRLELLEGIGRCRSISAAAREMGMSYRHAWLMVQSMNEAAGAPLIVAATGGRDGGGAQLTDLGRWAAEAFREMQEQLTQSAGALLRRTTASAPASIHVAAAVCLEEVLGQLLTDYGLQHPQVRIRAVYGASDELADQVLAGAPVDLFLSDGPEPLQRLEQASITAGRTRTILAENTLAVVGRADDGPAVRNAADLAQPGVGRIALADPTCPLGRYTRDYLVRAGLYDRLQSRTVYVDNSRAVSAAVRARTAAVGLVYGSDAAQASGCRLLFKARKGPRPIQLCGAVAAQGRHAADARSLLTFLASPAAGERFRRCGFLAKAKPAPADQTISS